MHSRQSRTEAAGRRRRPPRGRCPGGRCCWSPWAGAAGFALIFLTPGLDTRTRTALAFILAPVVVTPVFCLPAGFNRGSLVVGSVLGGEITALLYAAGQSGRFARWLAAVEVMAMLLTPGTLYMLRVARIPGVPQGDEAPSPAGIALIIVLAPFALAASVLYGMARFPAGAVIGCLRGGASPLVWPPASARC
jgi:hypothetical protein